MEIKTLSLCKVDVVESRFIVPHVSVPAVVGLANPIHPSVYLYTVNPQVRYF